MSEGTAAAFLVTVLGLSELLVVLTTRSLLVIWYNGQSALKLARDHSQ